MYVTKGRDHSEDQGVVGRIILKQMLGKYDWGLWNACI
jgi:hypothetical protein